jgi:hypothetical protein
MPKQVIHLSTQIITQFGVPADDGNSVEVVPVVAEGNRPVMVQVFSKEAFGEAFEQIARARAGLLDQLHAQPAEKPAAGGQEPVASEQQPVDKTTPATEGSMGR